MNLADLVEILQVLSGGHSRGHKVHRGALNGFSNGLDIIYSLFAGFEIRFHQLRTYHANRFSKR